MSLGVKHRSACGIRRYYFESGRLTFLNLATIRHPTIKIFLVVFLLFHV